MRAGAQSAVAVRASRRAACRAAASDAALHRPRSTRPGTGPSSGTARVRAAPRAIPPGRADTRSERTRNENEGAESKGERRQETSRRQGRGSNPGGAPNGWMRWAGVGSHLVSHQREKRRHDNGEPRRDEGRELEAARLAAARGENDEHVAPAQRRVVRPTIAPAGRRREAAGPVLALQPLRADARRDAP